MRPSTSENKRSGKSAGASDTASRNCCKAVSTSPVSRRWPANIECATTRYSLARGKAADLGCVAINCFNTSILFSAGSVKVNSTRSISSSGFDGEALALRSGDGVLAGDGLFSIDGSGVTLADGEGSAVCGDGVSVGVADGVSVGDGVGWAVGVAVAETEGSGVGVVSAVPVGLGLG